MSAKVQVDQYIAALGRLVARGAPISNDAVAIEAGKGRGSIKKSRPAHKKLIEQIDAAIKKQREDKVASDPVPALEKELEEKTRRLDQSLDRELALLNEVLELRAQNRQLADDNRQLRMGRLVPVQ